jgi:NADPH:quinone reductase-like Zn-dependent oxidoreductase
LAPTLTERAPVPAVAAGEVLVAVHAAAITFDELTWPETWTRDGVSRTPVIPSHEVSGVVTDIAPGVGDFAPGDEVYGLIRFDRDGAAADLGAEVTATVRSDAGELLRGVGAHRVRTEAFDEIGGAYDVVIDTVGGQTLDRSFRLLRRGGRLIALSAPPPAGKADEYGVTATFFIVEPNRDQLDELAALVESGRLRVEIVATFPLDRGRKAFESGQRAVRSAGKTVITVRSS